MTWDAFPPPLPSTSRRSPALPSPPPLGCATLACVPLSPLLVVHLRPSLPLQAKRLCTLVDGHLCKRTFVLATAICLSNGRLLVCVQLSTEICLCVYNRRQKFACVCTIVDRNLLVCVQLSTEICLCVYNCRQKFACVCTIVDRNLRVCVYNCRQKFACVCVHLSTEICVCVYICRQEICVCVYICRQDFIVCVCVDFSTDVCLR